MHVVAEEPGGATLQPPRPLRELIAVRFDLRDVMVWTDRDRTERTRVRVGGALVIHRDVEEPCRAVRLAGRLDLLEMTAKRLLALVQAEDRLEQRRPRPRPRC